MRKAADNQLAFDFRRLQVVANHWNPAYHLTWDDNRTAFYDEQPGFFKSIEDAASFARARGVEPEIPEETRKIWGKAS